MFKLRRHFSLTSLAGILAVLVALTLFYRHLAYETLIAQETRANVALTRSLANALLPDHAAFLRGAPGVAPARLAEHPEVARIREHVMNQIRGLKVVRLKIYDPDGTTVFSTDPDQIGESRAGDAGFARARDGHVASEFSFGEHSAGFDGEPVSRDVIASYVPVRGGSGGSPAAVFEVYADVTDLVREVDRTQWQMIGGLLGGLLLLYGFLYLIVARAERILNAQARERERQEAKIRFQAFHDGLTGLPNRASFNERLREGARRAHRAGSMCGVLFLDLDRFKYVNDSLGHHAGDRLLVLASQRIQSAVRESDLLFRMGGDEFTVLAESLEHPDEAGAVARRILTVMAEPFRIQGHEIVVTPSIGIAVYPAIYRADEADLETLVKNADAAMYLAKERGGNRFEFFTADITTRVLSRLSLESGLQRALRSGEFVLHYQLRVRPGDRSPVAVEALLRWRHPERGLVLPAEFLSVLEDTGLIVPVGAWVLRTGCAQLRAWRDADLPPLRMSVNVSTRQVSSGTLAEAVEAALVDAELDPGCLELELADGVLDGQAGTSSRVVASLRRLGVRVTLDDFGAGAPVLDYLRRSTVDFLKIDRRFVRDLESNPRDAAIVAAIAGLAERLGVGLVVEGIDREAQLTLLEGHPVSELQGNLFAAPMSAADLEAFLAAAGDSVSVGARP